MTDHVPDRRLALDWLRIAAFGLLIFYHVGMFYVTWDFHVKSPHASHAVEPLMQLLNPWRLSLLFLISGAATRFMLDKMSTGPFLQSRASRLGLPILFGVLVIVPPQTYYQVVEQLGFTGGPLDFYAKYLSFYQGWRPNGELLIVPTYNHLWFVVYLLIYTFVLAALAPLLRRVRLPGWALFAAPLIYLVVSQILLRPAFPETHALVDDWAAHAVYFAAFAFGYVIAKDERFFAGAAARWRLALCVTLAAYAARMVSQSLLADAPETPALFIADTVLRETQAWAAIMAAIGMAHRYWTADGPLRRYLTDAVFPFYIVHQTIIIVAGHHLAKLGLPALAEGAILIAGTALGCWATYEIVRRVDLLRPWFGLKRRARQLEKAIDPAPAGAT